MIKPGCLFMTGMMKAGSLVAFPGGFQAPDHDRFNDFDGRHEATDHCAGGEARQTLGHGATGLGKPDFGHLK